MHYGGKYFSKNGKDTLRLKNGERLKNNHELTYLDIKKLVYMYKNENKAMCKGKLCLAVSVPPLTCF